ncbi:TPA: hypothetical protein N0F65_009807 [Lagenidium giganteum]|uniref:SAP domain-containing protein n=1 Tax=Lagenidium giganteum TaxID=4803 RepID=A0AAV2YJQ0_9STRA|nr:TPA: hypothetical protein N0F65_009807 [Lagenidium giganteum]
MDDESALRAELRELARKKEQLDPSRRGGAGSRKSVFARLGGAQSNDSPRGGRERFRGGAARQVSLLKENAFDDNRRRQDGSGSGLGKRDRYGNGGAASAPKRQRLHSALARPKREVDPGRDHANAEEDEEEKEKKKRRVVAVYEQKDGKARSRRMFGALMGHLGKAKAQIEKDSDLFKRQDSKQHEAEAKEKVQSKQIEVQAKRDAVITRLERLIAKTEVELQEQTARLKLQHVQAVRKMTTLAQNLQTVSSPPIYYLPAKHTKETKDLVEASIEAKDMKVQAASRELEDKLRTLEAEAKSKLETYREQLEEAKQKAVEAPETTSKGDDLVDKDMEDNAVPRSPRKEKGAKVSGKDDEDMSESKDVDDANADGAEVKEDDKAESTKEGSHDEHDDRMDDKEENHRAESEPQATDDQTDNNSIEKDKGDSEKSAEKHKEEMADEEMSVEVPEDADAKAASPADDSAIDASNSQPTVDDGPENMKDTEESNNPAQGSTENDQASASPMNRTAEVDVASDSKQNPPSPQKEPHANADTESSAFQTPTKPTKSSLVPSSLKVTELREQLKKRGLDTKGLKSNLIKRLEEALEKDAS